MIRPSAASLPGRCLAAICADPGAHTAESLAARLLPYEAPPAPPPDARWARLGLAPVWSATTASARAAHLASTTATVARALSRLTEAGLLAPAGRTVALHPTSAALLAARGLPALLALGAPEPDDDAEGPDPDTSAAAEALLRALADGPTTYAVLLGPSPTGAAKRAYRALADALVISIPSHRHPTAAGIALASSWK